MAGKSWRTISRGYPGTGSNISPQQCEPRPKSPSSEHPKMTIFECSKSYDEDTSDKDFAVYIRDARSHVRSSRDAALLLHEPRRLGTASPIKSASFRFTAASKETARNPCLNLRFDAKG